jgi:protein TonB
MTHKPEKKIATGQIVLGIVVLLAIAGGIYVVAKVLSEDAPRKKETVNIVTLLKPPPMPEIKQKPPEPEPMKQMEKKQEIVDPTQNNAPKGPDNDATPAGKDLGIDAEGGAGSDGFGLVGRRGGRSLLSGGDGMGRMSLLSKYSGYTYTVSALIKNKVMKLLNDEGGIPKGRLQAVVRVKIDIDGTIIDYKIIGSSGNNRMDNAVKEALAGIKINETPPDGMPRTMDIKIVSQG